MPEPDLFGFASEGKTERKTEPKFIPLSARMRPLTIDEFVGQTHILEKDSYYEGRLSQIEYNH